MDRFETSRWVAALACALAVPTGAALAQTHHHDAGAPAQLTLDHGRKWTTDAPLRKGMGRIRALVEPQLPPAHAGKLDSAKYAALAGQIEAEVGAIVANCKLPPEADAVLHIVIAEIVGGADAMAGKNAHLQPAQGLVQVARAVNDYGRHFDDPGFRPVRGIR